MTFHRSFRKVAGIAAVAVATTFGAGVAMAGGPHGGHHGGGDVMIGQVIAHAKDKLALNTSQQGLFDTAVAHSRAAYDATRTAHGNVKATLQAELAKAEPDLAAVAAAADVAQDQARAQRNSIRNEWLALYATFSPAQKAVVKDAIQQHMAHMEGFREKMRERMKEKKAAKTT